MSRYFPDDFMYIPKEYLLPEEAEELKKATEED